MVTQTYKEKFYFNPAGIAGDVIFRFTYEWSQRYLRYYSEELIRNRRKYIHIHKLTKW